MNKTKRNSFHLLQSGKNVQGVGDPVFRERKSEFSMNFPTFGSPVLVGARSKVDLRGKGYVWALILWSSDNSKR